MDQQPDDKMRHLAASSPPAPSGELAQPAELALRKRQQTDDASRRFTNLTKQYAGRQDLAWWPENPKPDPCGRDELFFYRPGQLLVRKAELPVVKRVLRELGVEYCSGHDHGKHHEPVVRLLVSSRDPVPVLVRRLRCYGLESDVVGPNHVFWPSNLGGLPWLSGGAESIPREVAVSAGPVQMSGSRGENVTVLVFDSGLLPNWKNWDWLSNVDKIGPSDVEGQGGDLDGPGLDIFDCHATFVSGILTCTAPKVTVRVRNVLSELGDVDDHALCQTIRDTLDHCQLDHCQNVKLVNLSLGGTTFEDRQPLEMGNLVNEYPHVVFVAAAGNNGPGGAPFWPASLPNVVGVGALTHDGVPAPFSNTNPTSAKVWALGVDVINAFGTGELDYPAGTYHEYQTGRAAWSGTSFATPLVTGVLCGYVQSNSSANPSGIGAINHPSGIGAINWLNGVGRHDPVSGRVIISASP